MPRGMRPCAVQCTLTLGVTLVRLTVTIEKGRATLVLEDAKGRVIDSDQWVLPKSVNAAERRQVARDIFDDAYDNLNFTVHGFPATE